MTSYFGRKQQILLKSITSKLKEQYAQIRDKPMSAMWSHQIRLKRIQVSMSTKQHGPIGSFKSVHNK